jgi:hypothetical protein
MWEELLIVLRNDESARTSHVATGSVSWFSYYCQSTQCRAESNMEVRPRTETKIPTKRALVAIFFAGTKLLVLAVLSRE